MKSLQLYPQGTAARVDSSPAVPLTAACTRCSLHAKARTICLRAEGRPDRSGGTVGTLLVLAEKPTESDDLAGRPFNGAQGKYLRDIVEKRWLGPIVYDTAIRCAPGATKLSEAMFDACRGHLATVLAQAKPVRTLCIGPQAMQMLTGRPSNLDSRRGYVWLATGPAFVMHPAWMTMNNRYLRREFEADVDWALSVPDPPKPPSKGMVHMIETVEDATYAIHELRSQFDQVSVDTETFGRVGNREHRMVTLGLSGVDDPRNENASAFVWDEMVCKDMRACLEPVKDLLADPDIGLVGQNTKYDGQVLRFAGMSPKTFDADTLLWAKLLNSEGFAKLDILQPLVGMGGDKDEAGDFVDDAAKLINKEAKRPGTQAIDFGRCPPGHKVLALERVAEGDAEAKAYAYACMPPTVRARYCAKDCISAGRLALLYRQELFLRRDLYNVWVDTLQGASYAIQRMEANGVLVSLPAIHALSLAMKIREDAVIAKIHAIAPDLEPGSNPQLQAVLYTQLGETVRYKTPSGAPSVAAEALEKMKHPLAGLIQEWRRVTKFRSTYADAMEGHICDDGRVRSSINLGGAASGRASSSDPNVQNIPRPKSPEGKMCRDIFVAAPGYELLEADYSQIELRVACMLSQDPEMLKVFLSGEDYHLRTAKDVAVLLGVDPNTLTKDSPERDAAKITNFSVLYGKSIAGIAMDLNISRAKAEALVNAIMGKFKVLKKWIENQVTQGRQDGFTRTWWNGHEARYRPLPDLGSRNDEDRETAERSTYNCLDHETEALTVRGWVRGFDLRRDDVLLTKNASTGALEWQQVTDLRLFPDYRGEVVEFSSRSFSAVSTAEHRWLVRDKASGLDVCRTTTTLSPYGDHRIHRTGRYEGCVFATESDEFVELVGWFLTDGARPRRSRQVLLHQSVRANPQKVARIDALVYERLGIEGVRRSVRAETAIVTWTLSGPHAVRLRELFPERLLTAAFLLTLTREQAILLRETMMLGDGHTAPSHGATSGKRTFVTHTESGANAFQMLCTLSGVATTRVLRDGAAYSPQSSKLTNVPKGGLNWTVTLLARTTVQVTTSQRTTRTATRGVWCPVVPNTYFVMRREGKVAITGNTPIQGTAYEFTNASLGAFQRWLDENPDVDARLVLTVHDSIVVEVAIGQTPHVAAKLRQVMTQWFSAGVPLLVDLKKGTSWGSMTEYHP